MTQEEQWLQNSPVWCRVAAGLGFAGILVITATVAIYLLSS